MPITINDCKRCGKEAVVTLMVIDGQPIYAITCSDTHHGAMVTGRSFNQSVDHWNNLNLKGDNNE